jgi:PHP family Zn ribbon phosphoesterase
MDATPNKVERINTLLSAAEHHRSRLDVISREFVELHGEAFGSDEADELRHCIFEGDAYETVMRRLMNWKLQKYAADECETESSVQSL